MCLGLSIKRSPDVTSKTQTGCDIQICFRLSLAANCFASNLLPICFRLLALEKTTCNECTPRAVATECARATSRFNAASRARQRREDGTSLLPVTPSETQGNTKNEAKCTHKKKKSL